MKLTNRYILRTLALSLVLILMSLVLFTSGVVTLAQTTSKPTNPLRVLYNQMKSSGRYPQSWFSSLLVQAMLDATDNMHPPSLTRTEAQAGQSPNTFYHNTNYIAFGRDQYVELIATSTFAPDSSLSWDYGGFGDCPSGATFKSAEYPENYVEYSAYSDIGSGSTYSLVDPWLSGLKIGDPLGLLGSANCNTAADLMVTGLEYSMYASHLPVTGMSYSSSTGQFTVTIACGCAAGTYYLADLIYQMKGSGKANIFSKAPQLTLSPPVSKLTAGNHYDEVASVTPFNLVQSAPGTVDLYNVEVYAEISSYVAASGTGVYLANFDPEFTVDYTSGAPPGTTYAEVDWDYYMFGYFGGEQYPVNPASFPWSHWIDGQFTYSGTATSCSGPFAAFGGVEGEWENNGWDMLKQNALPSIPSPPSVSPHVTFDGTVGGGIYSAVAYDAYSPTPCVAY